MSFLASNWPFVFGIIGLISVAVAWWFLNEQDKDRRQRAAEQRRERRAQAEPGSMESVTKPDTPTTALARPYRRDPRRVVRRGGTPTDQEPLRRSVYRRQDGVTPPEDPPSAVAVIEEFPTVDEFEAVRPTEEERYEELHPQNLATTDTEALRAENDHLRDELSKAAVEVRVLSGQLASATRRLEGAEQRLAVRNADPLRVAIEAHGAPMSRAELVKASGFKDASAEFSARLLDAIRWGYIRTYRQHSEEGDVRYHLKGQSLPVGDATEAATARADEERDILLDSIDLSTEHEVAV